jgi:hypothetical protein
MAQIETKSVAAGRAISGLLARRFVTRLIVSSVSSAAGLVTLILTGPVMCQLAAIDPALEAFYLALVTGWLWSLARMWSLTCEARNRR